MSTDACREEDHSDADARAWLSEAIRRVQADANRSADTHLHVFPLPGDWGIDLYLKDESVHPTGSLKHRLARSLFLYGLCNGWICEGTTIIEASSGSTAVSEAFFARMLGLPFIAVMPRSTSQEKVDLITFYGGKCHFVDSAARMYDEARRLAAETNGHYMDQFTYAERATDWRGNNNIAESIFEQLAHERHPVPAWIVVGAGTGGTSATIGRYVRFLRHDTRLLVVDPENSAFFEGYCAGDDTVDHGRAVPDRGNRPPTSGGVVPGVGGRRDAVGPGRRLDRRGPLVYDADRAQRRRLDRHGTVGVAPPDRGHASLGRDRVGGHPALRRWRALREHLLRRRLAGRAGHRHRAVHRDAGEVRGQRRVGRAVPDPSVPASRPRRAWDQFFGRLRRRSIRLCG